MVNTKKSKTLSQKEKKNKSNTEKSSLLKIFSTLKRGKKEKSAPKVGVNGAMGSLSSQSELPKNQEDKVHDLNLKCNSLDRNQLGGKRNSSYINQLEKEGSKDELSVLKRSQKVDVIKFSGMKKKQCNLKENVETTFEVEEVTTTDGLKKQACETLPTENNQKLQVEKIGKSTNTDKCGSSYEKIFMENKILHETLNCMKQQVGEIENQRQKMENAQAKVTKALLSKEDEVLDLRKKVMNLQRIKNVNKDKVKDFSLMKKDVAKKTKQIAMLKSELNDSKILLKSIECQVNEKQAEIDQMKNKEVSPKTQLVKKFGWFFCTYCKHSWTSDNVLCYPDSNRVFVLQTCNICKRITHPYKVKKARFRRRRRKSADQPRAKNSVVSEEASTETSDLVRTSSSVSGSRLMAPQCLDDSVVLL